MRRSVAGVIVLLKDNRLRFSFGTIEDVLRGVSGEGQTVKASLSGATLER